MFTCWDEGSLDAMNGDGATGCVLELVVVAVGVTGSLSVGVAGLEAADELW